MKILLTGATGYIGRHLLKELLKTDQPGITTEQSWRASADFMKKTGLLDRPVEINKLYTNQFIK